MSATNDVAIPDFQLSASELASLDASDLRSAQWENIDALVNFDEAFAASGLSESEMTFITSYYKVLNNTGKDELLSKPVFVRGVRFQIDQETERPFMVGYAVTRDGMFLFTDGSTGLLAQFGKEVKKRLSEGHPTPFENFSLANGLRKSEYGVDKNGTPVKPGEKFDSKATTYYVA